MLSMFENKQPYSIIDKTEKINREEEIDRWYSNRTYLRNEMNLRKINQLEICQLATSLSKSSCPKFLEIYMDRL